MQQTAINPNGQWPMTICWTCLWRTVWRQLLWRFSYLMSKSTTASTFTKNQCFLYNAIKTVRWSTSISPQ